MLIWKRWIKFASFQPVDDKQNFNNSGAEGWTVPNFTRIGEKK